MPGRKKRFGVFVALSVCMVLLAWTMSALSEEISGNQSGRLKALLEWMTGWQWDEHMLRKLAHFIEYALLGIFSGLALAQTRWRLPRAALVWGLCLFAALVDETIQIFSGRGSQIPDVWLDGAGALSGLALSLGLSSLKKWISKRRI